MQYLSPQFLLRSAFWPLWGRIPEDLGAFLGPNATKTERESQKKDRYLLQPSPNFQQILDKIRKPSM
jgi:hypothetical protein